jgi:signal transduction histidine kinase
VSSAIAAPVSTQVGHNGTGRAGTLSWLSTIRARLYIALGFMAATTVVCSLIALYAFNNIGGTTTEIVSQSMPATVHSLRLAEGTSALVASAPQLMTAEDEARRSAIAEQIAQQTQDFLARIDQLRMLDPNVSTDIRAAQVAMVDRIAALNQAVTERIAISDRRQAMAASIRKAHEELLEGITPAIDDATFELMTKGQAAENTAASNEAIESLRRLLEVQAEANLLAGLLIESSLVTEGVRLQPLRELIDAARGRIETNLKALPNPEQQRQLVGLYDRLAAMAGQDGIIAVRARELRRQHEAQLAFAATQTEAVKLKQAVDWLVEQQGKEAEAVSARAAKQIESGRILLIALAITALVAAGLISWLYVGRNIVSRLAHLSSAMLAIAAGRRESAVPVTGADEVGAMGRAVEIFRRNAVELDQLLAERADAAIKLEKIVEQRTAELQRRGTVLRVTFENMGNGVLMFDHARKLAAWNREVVELLDLPQSFLASEPYFADYIRFLAARGEYGSTNVEGEVQRLLAAATQRHSFERARPNGTVLEVRHNPLPEGGMVIIYTNITAAKHREQELEAARDSAAEARRKIEEAYRELKITQASLVHSEKMASLGQLTAGIAHEIKNPLNFVNNFADISSELLDEAREALIPATESMKSEERTDIEDIFTTLSNNMSKIAEHGRRADGIVKSMLLHSRGGSTERQITNINPLIEEALNLAYHGARAQDKEFNITLERDLDPNLGALEVVPQDITRVFLNLFGNGFYAAKKRQCGGNAGADYRPVLAVTTRDLGDQVEARVRDNGVGVPPDVQAKMFTPFFTTKPTGEGTGLGLSISYEIIVQQHGGTITVDSRLDEFTEFVIRLPRRSGHAEEPRIAAGATA